MKSKQDKIKGIIGTIVFHLLILIAFIFAGFRTPLPLPEEIGVEIQGGSSLGLGDNINMDAASAPSRPQQASSEQYYSSQNIEETPNVKVNKTEKDKTNKVEETKSSKFVPDASYFSNKTGSSDNQGKGGYGSSEGSGAGNNPGIGKGTGLGSGTGPGYSLEGRTASYLPEPDRNFTESGIIVVDIWVDREGNIIRVKAGARGSTSTNQHLKKLAEEAARKSKFQPKRDALEEQTGTITYVFRLD